MIFNYYGFYVPIECSTNNIEWLRMIIYTTTQKYMDLADDNFEAQCSVRDHDKRRVSSEADGTCGRSSSIKVAIHQEL